MSGPLEDLIRQSNDFHAQMIADNNELDRAFQSGTFGKLVHSWGNEDGGSDDNGAGDSLELEGKNSSNVVEGESGGTGGRTETNGQTV